MDTPIPLGPFDLETSIGHGGMGSIWKGVHRAQGVPVAVKVIKSGVDEDFQEAFLHEVRLVAGLDHPNVVMVFDYGLVDQGAADLDPTLMAGSPYLAMELANAGSLAGYKTLAWPALVHVLTSTLDALGHAHARGIVHRDIKPGNILLAGERAAFSGKPATIDDARIVLSDFGISRDAHAGDMYEGSSVGTPAYMAPEQINGHWRDQGPWTDLYAVGVLAWRLTTGRVVFHSMPQLKLLMSHLAKPPPAFQPEVRVPPGFEDWVRKMLAKEPQQRFLFAADAKRALLELGGATRTSAGTVPAPDISDLPTDVGAGGVKLTSLSALMAGPTTLEAETAPAWQPVAWREEEKRDFRLQGAGLGLYGLRQLRMVDRKQERDLLWGSLVRARTSGRGEAVVLRGPSGVGKSRLAEWLSMTAHEAGAAVTLRAVHNPKAGPEHGLARMAARFLYSDGLEGEELFTRIDTTLGKLGEDDASESLAQMVAPHLLPGRLTRRERNRVIERLLRSVAGTRGVLLWLEDVQWGPESLTLVEELLDRQQRVPFPLLIVMTVLEESLPDHPEAAARIEEIAARRYVNTCAVEPLSGDDHRELVRELLGLEGSLAVEVEEKTAGNPLFAVQLVGDWVERGLLHASERGFRLPRGVEAEIPDSIVSVWEDRLERLLATRDEHDAQALELAAVLGLEVPNRTWREACLLAGLRPDPGLLPTLMAQRLARIEDERGERWALANGMLREALTRRARDGGRWEAHNLVAATLLRGSDSVDPERLAHHLLAAGRPEEALDPLIQASTNQLDAGDYRSSVLLQELEAALKAVQLPREDPRWGDLWLLWAWLYRVRGQPEEAERWSIRAERAARRHDWEETLPRALRSGGLIAIALGRSDAAQELLREAMERYADLDDEARARHCRSAMADNWLNRGDVARARTLYEGVVAGVADDDPELAWVAASGWLGLALVARAEGRLGEMPGHLEHARRTAITAGGMGDIIAKAANLEGEAARLGGDLDAAEAFYREAVDRFRAFDDGQATLPTLNLGVVLVCRRDYQEANTLTQALLAEFERTGVQPVFAAYARCVLLPCTAHLQDWAEFDAQLDWLTRFLSRSGLVDKDIGLLASIAGDEARRSSRQHAAKAYEMAAVQYEAIGKTDMARSLRTLARNPDAWE